MRIKQRYGRATLAGFVAMLSIGCFQSTDVPLAPASPVPDVPRTEGPPKSIKQGGGPGSTGNMNRNPGADT